MHSYSKNTAHVLQQGEPPFVHMRSEGEKMAANVQQATKLEKLQFQLEAFIESLRTVGVIAGDFQQNGQTNFNEKL